MSHLLFANDTQVFYEDSHDQMVHLSWLLILFKATSRLKVNLDKSDLIPIKGVVDVVELAMEMGCKVGEFPSTYLGLPSGALFRSSSVWNWME